MNKQTGDSFCQNFAKGKQCKAKHCDKPTEGIKTTKVWKKLLDRYGPPNGPPKGKALETAKANAAAKKKAKESRNSDSESSSSDSD